MPSFAGFPQPRPGFVRVPSPRSPQGTLTAGANSFFCGLTLLLPDAALGPILVPGELSDRISASEIGALTLLGPHRAPALETGGK